MASKSKTFINDLGSAVVAEITTQLNTALSVTPMANLRQPTAAAGTGAADSTSVATGAKSSGVLFVAPEDCFVTSVKLASLTTQLDTSGTPASTSFILCRVPQPWIQASGSTEQNRPYLNTVSVHGDNAAVALGADTSTYQVVFTSTGAAFTDDNGFDAFQIGELVGLTATGGAAGAIATAFDATLIAIDHAESPAVSIPAAGFAMNAGDVLMWGLNNVTGAAVQLQMCVGYRPVKDKITLSPAQTVKAFNSVDR